MDSMMIPFVMLLIITIALVLERKFQEDKIVDIYENKLEEWKKHASINPEDKSCKELVGLVFSENSKLTIELLDVKAKDKLERKKYTLKDLRV